MNKAPDRLRTLAPALIATTFVLAFGPSTSGLAQDNEQEANTASSTATTADQPRRNRQRRRAEHESAASADTQAQTAAGSATDVAAPDVEVINVVEVVEERLVCKSEKLAGTKIARRTCGTPEQWAARARQTSRAAQDAVQEIRDRNSFPAPPEVPLAIP
jgi:hypothetical protein